MNCSQLREDDHPVVESCMYWIEGISLMTVGGFGMVTNILAIFILTSKEMQNSFNWLLTFLALFDTIFISFVIFDYSLIRALHWPFDMESTEYAILVPGMIYPINNIMFTASVYVTVSIAYERYFAVCKPYDYRSLCNRKSLKCRVISFILPVTVFSVVLNIPRFFETELVLEERDEPTEPADNNASIANSTSPQMFLTYNLTDLRMNEDYIRYYLNWCQLTVTCIIPFLVLAYFNYKIFMGIKYSHIRTGNRAKRETKLAFILICIVFVFAFCQIPRIVLNTQEIFMTDEMIRCREEFNPPAWFHCGASVSHLLLVFSASSNFLIYFSLSSMFKRSLKLKMCRFASFLKTCTEKNTETTSEAPIDMADGVDQKAEQDQDDSAM